MPPSMINDWPVIQLDSSAGQEQRPVGDLDRLAEAAHRDVHEPAVALGVVGQELGQHRRHDRARAQRVGTDALPGVDHGDLAGHRQHRALRRGVRDLRRRRTHVRDERCDVDDRSAARLLADSCIAGIAYLHPSRTPSTLMSIVCWYVSTRRRHRVVVVAQHHAGVVVEHVQTAERLDRVLHRCLDRRRVGDVAAARSVASPPAAAIASTASSPSARSAMTTCAPSAANNSAPTRPNPDDAPVISATFPARRSATCPSRSAPPPTWTPAPHASPLQRGQTGADVCASGDDVEPAWCRSPRSRRGRRAHPGRPSRRDRDPGGPQRAGGEAGLPAAMAPSLGAEASLVRSVDLARRGNGGAVAAPVARAPRTVLNPHVPPWSYRRRIMQSTRCSRVRTVPSTS